MDKWTDKRMEGWTGEGIDRCTEDLIRSYVEAPSIVPGTEKSFSISVVGNTKSGHAAAGLSAHFLEVRVPDQKPRPRVSPRQKYDRSQLGSAACASHQAWALPSNDAEQWGWDALETVGPVRAELSLSPPPQSQRLSFGGIFGMLLNPSVPQFSQLWNGDGKRASCSNCIVTATGLLEDSRSHWAEVFGTLSAVCSALLFNK